MAADDEALREAARHRGLKLVKSRRRKPGGDFGRYGLTDAKGAALMGIGDDGLTATAEEVSAYLRGAGATTWAESADATPDRVMPEPPSAPSPPPPTRARPEPAPPPTPPPPPPLKPLERGIRSAGAHDTAAIVALVRMLAPDASQADAERRLAELLGAPEPVLVAERGAVVGVLAWHAIPMLQHAAVARITLLVVAEDERRQGTARALIDAALPAMAEGGCDRIELVSPIEIGGISGFLRRVGFEQTHYGYRRRTRTD